MGIALVGIIVVQTYLISRAIAEKEEQFRLNANQLVETVADEIQQRELREFVGVMSDTVRSKVRKLSGLQLKIDRGNDSELFYSNSVFEWTSEEKDTISDKVKQIVSKRVFRSVNKNNPDGNKNSAEYRFQKIGRINEIDKALFYTTYRDISGILPIERRTSKEEIEKNVQEELKKKDLTLPFKYAIYKNDSLTAIRSADFKLDKNRLNNFEAPFLPNNERYTPYKLVIVFPDKNAVILSSLFSIAGLSAIFTLSIILAYGYTLYQSIYQRRASRVKTDFVNNMTHEFKTPIATINIALGALKNQKIIENNDMRDKYLKVIGEENERLHNQVEHVLKIAQFQSDKIKLDFEPVSIESIIDKAIDRVRVIVESKNGYVKTHYGAQDIRIRADREYMTNAIVNLLDNAIKYSPEKIAIDIFTELGDREVQIKVKDKGIGMSKSVQSKVFERFYREQSGNIHDVKGHGLGLTFVKYVVLAHRGKIDIESEKHKGSTFCITLPLP